MVSILKHLVQWTKTRQVLIMNVSVCLINVMLKMQLLSMKRFVCYGRTVQSDINICHNVIIASFRLRCSQHWGNASSHLSPAGGTPTRVRQRTRTHTHTHRKVMFIITHTRKMDSSNFNGTEEYLNTRWIYYDDIIDRKNNLKITGWVLFINSF